MFMYLNVKEGNDGGFASIFCTNKQNINLLLVFSYEITNFFAGAACAEIYLTIDAPILMPPSALSWCLLIGSVNLHQWDLLSTGGGGI